MACWPQLHAIDAFKCDVVLVLDSERLYAEMSDHYRRAASTIEVPLRGMAPPRAAAAAERAIASSGRAVLRSCG
jgi:hypothetical protein